MTNLKLFFIIQYFFKKAIISTHLHLIKLKNIYIFLKSYHHRDPLDLNLNELLFLESDRIDWFTLLDDHGTEITEGITNELEFNFETLDVNGRNALHTAVIKNDPDLIKVRTNTSNYVHRVYVQLYTIQNNLIYVHST